MTGRNLLSLLFYSPSPLEPVSPLLYITIHYYTFEKVRHQSMA